MNHRQVLGGLTLSVSALLLSGCETLSSDTFSVPFMSKSEAATEEATARESKPETLSRAEKISRGLSEELDWFPDLEQPIAELEADYANEMTPAQRQQTLSSIAYVYDAHLFLLFQDMLDFLHPDARIRELEEQDRWLDQREVISTQAFLHHKKETQARSAASKAFIKATRERIAEIEEKRKKVIIQ